MPQTHEQRPGMLGRRFQHPLSRDSQLGATVPPYKGHHVWRQFRFVEIGVGTTGIKWVEAVHAAQRPVILRTAPDKNTWASNVSRAQAEEPGL